MTVYPKTLDFKRMMNIFINESRQARACHKYCTAESQRSSVLLHFPVSVEPPASLIFLENQTDPFSGLLFEQSENQNQNQNKDQYWHHKRHQAAEAGVGALVVLERAINRRPGSLIFTIRSACKGVICFSFSSGLGRRNTGCSGKAPFCLGYTQCSLHARPSSAYEFHDCSFASIS